MFTASMAATAQRQLFQNPSGYLPLGFLHRAPQTPVRRAPCPQRQEFPDEQAEPRNVMPGSLGQDTAGAEARHRERAGTKIFCTYFCIWRWHLRGTNLSGGHSPCPVTQNQSKQGNSDRYLLPSLGRLLLEASPQGCGQQTPTGNKSQNCSCLNLWEAALREILLILLN